MIVTHIVIFAHVFLSKQSLKPLCIRQLGFASRTPHKKQHIPSIRFPSRSSGFLMNMSIIIDKSQTEDYPFLLTIIVHY